MNAFMATLVGQSPSGRVDSNCDVNWRNVWGVGVVGFFTRGTQGAIVGCAGGTVVLPAIGTATGCVGGAVFGAAGGFIEGSVYAIATELLLFCFRSDRQPSTSCMGDQGPDDGLDSIGIFSCFIECERTHFI